jgi:hypothetical protein
MPLYGRSTNTVSTMVMLHKEAREFLDTLVHGRTGHGQVLSQLLLAEKARREERQRLSQVLAQTQAELVR